MSYETVLLPKWLSHQGRILAKEQFYNSYTFWAIPILIFSPVQIIMTHPLYFIVIIFLFIFLHFKVMVSWYHGVTSFWTNLAEINMIFQPENFYENVFWRSWFLKYRLFFLKMCPIFASSVIIFIKYLLWSLFFQNLSFHCIS